MPKKIAIIGPESTGKSTLSEKLADHYNTVWVPEYAREFLLNNGNKYTYDDLLTIAHGQIKLEDQLQEAAKNNLLIIDTNMVVMKVWCEYVFQKCHPFILEQLSSRSYDLYLLCSTDLPWVEDELREYPDPAVRHELFEIYQNFLINQQVPWVEINGDSTDRLRKAVTAIDKLLDLENQNA